MRWMPELSRSQVLVYGAIAVALLLVGARWVRASDHESSTAGGLAEASAQGGGDSLEVDHGHGDLVIHVAGAVRESGVYRLPDGSRVTDAIERAGGPTRDAAGDGINLAAPLGDGQQVVVPARDPRSPTALGAVGGGAAAGPISLGTATVEELDTIEGIGPVTAEQIVEFREQRGGIGSIDELDQISGIGPATMEALRAELQP